MVMETNSTKLKIAERLRELRKEKELNQIETAKLLNIDKSTIAKYETGTAVPSVNMLVALAKFFDVSAGYILGLED